MTSQATQSDFATTRDGTRISYQLVPGNGRGRCVLVHSLAMDKSFWNSTVAALAGACDVLILDCRGHGKSDKPEGPYSVEQFADDIADVMDHVGWTSAVVAGASMGGCVTLAFAGRHPKRVDGLGLFDTTAWYGENAPEAWAERGNKALNEGLSSSSLSRKPAGSAMPSAKRTPMFSTPPSRFSWRMICRLMPPHVLCWAQPTCVRFCRNSISHATSRSVRRTTPRRRRWQKYLADHIPGSKMEIMEGVRHFSPLEVPVVIADALIDVDKAA